MLESSLNTNVGILKSIEFKSKNVQLPLTKVVVKTNEEDEIYLSLFSNKTEIIEVYSSKEMITFLQFLVEPAVNYPILEIIRGLQIPKTDQLNKVIAKFKSMEKALISIHGKVQKMISKMKIIFGKIYLPK